MLPKVTALGNTGRDAEMRYLMNGTAKTEFSLACSRKKRDGTEDTEWVNCVLWGDRAEKISQFITKGKKLYVEGELRSRSWDDDEGRRHYRTEVHVNQVEFLDGSPKEEPREKTGDMYDDLPFS